MAGPGGNAMVRSVTPSRPATANAGVPPGIHMCATSSPAPAHRYSKCLQAMLWFRGGLVTYIQLPSKMKLMSVEMQLFWVAALSVTLQYPPVTEYLIKALRLDASSLTGARMCVGGRTDVHHASWIVPEIQHEALYAVLQQFINCCTHVCSSCRVELG